jgi:hypothetical protein
MWPYCAHGYGARETYGNIGYMVMELGDLRQNCAHDDSARRHDSIPYCKRSDVHMVMDRHAAILCTL